MRRVLIAGSTGYLGKHVVAAARERGHWVRALARNPESLDGGGQFLEPAVRDRVDEVFTGEATRPETLGGLCDGIDGVFSSLGITRQRDNLSFHDVDYQANRNILDVALAAGVKKFVFVSVFGADVLRRIGMVEAREQFVADLRAAPIAATVVRPTGFYSDMSEFFHMARSRRIYLIGDGWARINPIHGADLASICVDAFDRDTEEIAVGGPETFTYRQIAELAFSVVGAKPRITHLPGWLVGAGLRIARPFSPRLHDLGRFFTTVTQNDFVAPPTGRHTLGRYFASLAEKERSST